MDKYSCFSHKLTSNCYFKMDVRILVAGLVILATISPNAAQLQCPGSADTCLSDAGVGELSASDPTKLCTYVPQQLDEASACVQRCGYQVPQIFAQAADLMATICSQKSGCENFIDKYETFESCYNSTENLRKRIQNIIGTYNLRSLGLQECLDLRSVRSCMKRTSPSCQYIKSIYTNLAVNLQNFDVALHICGAEDVDKHIDNSNCQGAETNIVGQCSIACNLTSAKTAGEFCLLLQYQSDCIVRNSQGCTAARELYLQPRIDTYSVINQLFLCNITVSGVNALPRFGSNCDYRNLVKNCIGLELPSQIPFQTVQQLVNGEVPIDEFCRLYDAKEELVRKCLSSSWSCLVPVSQVYTRDSKSFEKDFDPSLGTLPLSNWGLNHVLKGCTVSPPQAIQLCSKHEYDRARPTPRRERVFTPGPRIQTPPRQ